MFKPGFSHLAFDNPFRLNNYSHISLLCPGAPHLNTTRNVTVLLRRKAEVSALRMCRSHDDSWRGTDNRTGSVNQDDGRRDSNGR